MEVNSECSWNTYDMFLTDSGEKDAEGFLEECHFHGVECLKELGPIDGSKSWLQAEEATCTCTQRAERTGHTQEMHMAPYGWSKGARGCEDPVSKAGTPEQRDILA